jgi:hypothetical protein
MRWAVYGVAISLYKILVRKSRLNFNIYNTVKWILFAKSSARKVYVHRENGATLTFNPDTKLVNTA